MRTSFAHLVTPQVYVYIFGLIYIYIKVIYTCTLIFGIKPILVPTFSRDFHFGP